MPARARRPTGGGAVGNALLEVTKRVQGSPLADWFLMPHPDAPTGKKLITLGVIFSKCGELKYSTRFEYLADYELMWQNTRAANGADAVISMAAQKLVCVAYDAVRPAAASASDAAAASAVAARSWQLGTSSCRIWRGGRTGNQIGCAQLTAAAGSKMQPAVDPPRPPPALRESEAQLVSRLVVRHAVTFESAPDANAAAAPAGPRRVPHICGPAA